MRIIFTLYLLIFISAVSAARPAAQDSAKIIRLGASYTKGSQQMFPYNDKDYSYSFNGVKLLFNYPLKTGKISYELQAEPSVYYSHHQLLNEYYLQPESGTDYLLQREIYTREKTIIEYALNIGIQVRYNINESYNLFILASIGPMYSNTQTERLARGFAFSDIMAIGAAYRTGRLTFEIRPGVRHVSNADLKMPNAGHNAATIDFGISVAL